MVRELDINHHKFWYLIDLPFHRKVRPSMTVWSKVPWSGVHGPLVLGPKSTRCHEFEVLFNRIGIQVITVWSYSTINQLGRSAWTSFGLSGHPDLSQLDTQEEIRFFCSSIVSRSFITLTSSISVMLFVLALLLFGLFLYVVAVPRSLNPALSSEPATLS